MSAPRKMPSRHFSQATDDLAMAVSPTLSRYTTDIPRTGSNGVLSGLEVESLVRGGHVDVPPGFDCSGGSETVVAHTFHWGYGGEDVCVRGNFTQNPWEDDVPLSANAAQADDMTATVYFPPGTFLYKFVVDGEWRFVSHVAIQADEAGNINNVLEFDDADAFPRDKARFLEEI